MEGGGAAWTQSTMAALPGRGCVMLKDRTDDALEASLMMLVKSINMNKALLMEQLKGFHHF